MLCKSVKINIAMHEEDAVRRMVENLQTIPKINKVLILNVIGGAAMRGTFFGKL